MHKNVGKHHAKPMDKNRKNQQKITDDELARLEELNNKRKSLGKERDAAEGKKYRPFKKVWKTR